MNKSKIIFLLILLNTCCFADSLTLNDYYKLTEIGSSKNILFNNIEAIKNKCNDTSTYSKEDFLSNVYYMPFFSKKLINGNDIKVGRAMSKWTGELNTDFVNLMSKYPNSNQYILTAERRKQTSKLYTFIGAGLLNVALFSFLYGIMSGSDNRMNTCLTISAISIPTGFLSVGIGIGYMVSGENNFRRALYEYNGNIMIKYCHDIK